MFKKFISVLMLAGYLTAIVGYSFTVLTCQCIQHKHTTHCCHCSKCNSFNENSKALHFSATCNCHHEDPLSLEYSDTKDHSFHHAPVITGVLNFAGLEALLNHISITEKYSQFIIPYVENIVIITRALRAPPVLF